VRRTLDEVGAGAVLAIDVYNKCDVLDPAERERLQRREPDALCVSAVTGLGRTELVDAIAARLALDVRRVVVKLDLSLEADRLRLAQIYRFGRVDQHTEHGNDVWIEADVPRRLWGRLQRGGQDESE
jgi:50S ribosomal subunit-associated GTPase HflX